MEHGGEGDGPVLAVPGAQGVGLAQRSPAVRAAAVAGVVLAVEDAGGVACRYVDPSSGKPTQSFPHNPNGSQHAIAGLCDPTGRVFGMMPHPEAFLFPWNHPRWDLEKAAGKTLPEAGDGLAIFRNAVAYLRT